MTKRAVPRSSFCGAPVSSRPNWPRRRAPWESDFLDARGDLRVDLDRAAAHDLLWSLTGPDLYRLLVAERGWPAGQYETRLYDLLARALLRPDFSLPAGE